MLTHTDHKGKRVYHDATGCSYVSVTSAIRIIAYRLGEPDPYDHVSESLRRIHQLEGEACHAACLNWLAFAHGLLPHWAPPEWPAYAHPDQDRWRNVMAAAVQAFQGWAEARHVALPVIEHASVNRHFGLAGRPDLFAIVDWRGRRTPGLIDLKFVGALQRSHEIQVRLYGKLEAFTDAKIGFLLRIDRATAQVEERVVFLNERPDDVAAAINASQLERWALTNGGGRE